MLKLTNKYLYKRFAEKNVAFLYISEKAFILDNRKKALDCERPEKNNLDRCVYVFSFKSLVAVEEKSQEIFIKNTLTTVERSSQRMCKVYYAKNRKWQTF